ncbi:MAG: undecaprenyl-diphosphate phosphatase [Candidatus Coprovivens sp.]
MIKYIIISIIGSITILLPISYSTHIFIYKNIFNTNIFSNQYTINIVFLSIPISLLYIYKKDIFKYLLLPIKNITTKNKYKKSINNIYYFLITCILSTIILLFIPTLKLSINNTPIYLFILSIIIILINNKKGNRKINDLNIKDTLIFSISHIINIIPTISPLCSNLLISKALKFNKTLSIKYSLLTLIPLYILKSIPIILYLIINTNYIPYYILIILISTIINIFIINYLKDLYYNNKIYKLSIYLFILAIFLLYWFR